MARWHQPMGVSVRHQKVLDKVLNGSFSRADLARLRVNALELVRKGDGEAQAVVDAIMSACPSDTRVVFMGFCPGADFNNRLDIEWKAKGVCTFSFLDSDQQVARFNEICTGDLIVLKKRHVFGKTMRLFGHGRVSSIAFDENGKRYLNMRWSAQDEEIEVPLMAANSTVDIRSMEQVEADMPDEFFKWLATPEFS
ncbi:hypothetical protein LQ772_15840 [Frateuria edaphi]|uniref:hypothetical protein n=1 Tax=Frateuria edaphi TaxID=2898793 RepID=UPI001E48E38C|nr:hypothetical protein [Frateuria edaphi]UGB45429.1 hypothetical protein LQ772_15840 [Frateuria edaphi]